MVTANEPVGEPSAKQGHEIVRKNEQVKNNVRRVLILAQTSFPYLAADIACEYSEHPIIAKAFAGFVSHDELDLARETIDRRPAVGFAFGYRDFWSGHAEAFLPRI